MLSGGFLIALVNALVACQSLRPAAPCDDSTCEPPATVRLGFRPKQAAQDALGPRVSKHPSMQALAHDLDHLERHIDIYGSVTAKGPDIWGEARLTRDREDIDKQLEAELGEFKARLQGKLTRSDQAILESATALSIIAAPQSAGAVANALKPATTYQAAPLVEKSRTQTQSILDGKGNVVSKEERVLGLAEKEPEPAAAPKADAPKAPPADDAKALIKDPGKLVRNNIPAPIIPGIGGYFADDKIGIEPTEYLNQKKRYLDYLTQLRRQNEGDDNADSPGYAMNLFRIPVSVLPGKRTDTGHGAEVTFTVNSVLSDELLPTTFRTLVTNDLVNQLGFPLTKMLEPANRDGQVDLFSDENRIFIRYLRELEQLVELTKPGGDTVKAAALSKTLPQQLQIAFKQEQLKTDYRQTKAVKNDYNPTVSQELNQVEMRGLDLTKIPRSPTSKSKSPLLLNKFSLVEIDSIENAMKPLLFAVEFNEAINKDRVRNEQKVKEVTKRLSQLNGFTVPFSTGTRGASSHSILAIRRSLRRQVPLRSRIPRPPVHG